MEMLNTTPAVVITSVLKLATAKLIFPKKGVVRLRAKGVCSKIRCSNFFRHRAR